MVGSPPPPDALPMPRQRTRMRLATAATVASEEPIKLRQQQFTKEFEQIFVESGIMSGATVAITQGDTVGYHRAFGMHNNNSYNSNSKTQKQTYLDDPPDDPNPDEEVVVGVYSTTKVATLTTCLQLVERVLLPSLEDPISKYLPSCCQEKSTTATTTSKNEDKDDDDDATCNKDKITL